jgi:hypothetical protein
VPREVVGLSNISVRSLVSSSSLAISPLVFPPVRWGPGSCQGVHQDRGVIQPGWCICRVVLPLSILSLGPWAILSLEEGLVRGSEGVKSSWCISLDGVDELS